MSNTVLLHDENYWLSLKTFEIFSDLIQLLYFSAEIINSISQLGAAAVNLVAGEKPADVYSGIANRQVTLKYYKGHLCVIMRSKFWFVT